MMIIIKIILSCFKVVLFMGYCFTKNPKESYRSTL